MIRKLLTASIVATTAALLTATPAWAGTGIDWTYAWENGASARFVPEGAKVQVCDRALDGMRARAYVESTSNRPHDGVDTWHWEGYADDTSTDGNCTVKSFEEKLLEGGEAVRLKVCVHRASDGRDFGCHYSTEGNA